MSLSIVGQQIKTSLVGDYDYWKMDYKKKGERLTRLTEYTFSSSFLETRVNNYLFQKYASSQNYYYTRDINDMLSDSRSGPSFIIRDTMAYFETEEYFNRIYKLKEYDDKVELLTEYYKFHNDVPRLFMIPIAEVIHNFYDKKRRLNYIKVTKMLKGEVDWENIRKEDESDSDSYDKEYIPTSSMRQIIPESLMNSILMCRPSYKKMNSSKATSQHSKTIRDLNLKLSEMFENDSMNISKASFFKEPNTIRKKHESFDLEDKPRNSVKNNRNFMKNNKEVIVTTGRGSRIQQSLTKPLEDKIKRLNLNSLKNKKQLGVKIRAKLDKFGQRSNDTNLIESTLVGKTNPVAKLTSNPVKGKKADRNLNINNIKAVKNLNVNNINININFSNRKKELEQARKTASFKEPSTTDPLKVLSKKLDIIKIIQESDINDETLYKSRSNKKKPGSKSNGGFFQKKHSEASRHIKNNIDFFERKNSENVMDYDSLKWTPEKLADRVSKKRDSKNPKLITTLTNRGEVFSSLNMKLMSKSTHRGINFYKSLEKHPLFTASGKIQKEKLSLFEKKKGTATSIRSRKAGAGGQSKKRKSKNKLGDRKKERSPVLIKKKKNSSKDLMKSSRFTSKLSGGSIKTKPGHLDRKLCLSQDFNFDLLYENKKNLREYEFFGKKDSLQLSKTGANNGNKGSFMSYFKTKESSTTAQPRQQGSSRKPPHGYLQLDDPKMSTHRSKKSSMYDLISPDNARLNAFSKRRGSKKLKEAAKDICNIGRKKKVEVSAGTGSNSSKHMRVRSEMNPDYKNKINSSRRNAYNN